MMDPTPVAVLWSGGKDACIALHDVFRCGEYSVEALLTTITEDYDRISMHGVRRELLERQADALGIPLRTVGIPKGATNAEYEAEMDKALGGFRREGVEAVVCGDLFLEDVREYREKMFRRVGLGGLYPVWDRDTGEFARELVDLGYRAVVVCLDPNRMGESFSGREIDHDFIADLPPEVDPCGENGEFHTFVYDGPNFSERVEFEVGETVLRDGFVFTDLLPAD